MRIRMRRRVAVGAVAACGWAGACGLGAVDGGKGENAPAVFAITEEVAAPAPVPFGLNFLVGPKGFNNLDRRPASGSMEPEFQREFAYADEAGEEKGNAWFASAKLAKSPDYADGYWDGGTARVYRREGDKAWRRVHTGKIVRYQGMRGFVPASAGPSFEDAGKRKTDYVVRADAGTAFVDGRLCEFYQQTDLRDGAAYYYVVRAVDAHGLESADSNVVKAAPDRKLDTGPRIMTWGVNGPGGGKAKRDGSAAAYREWLEATGGVEPLKWELAEGELPAGLALGSEKVNGRTKGLLSGSAAVEGPVWLTVRVTDAKGRSDTRRVGLGLPLPPGVDGKKKRPAKKKGEAQSGPGAPTGLKGVALDGGVALSWEPSPDAGVVGYKVYRSSYPPEEQKSRVVLEGGAGQVQAGDMVFLDIEKMWRPVETYPDTRLFQYWERAPYQTFFKAPDSEKWEDWKALESLDAGMEAGVRRVAHSGTLPPEMAAEAEKGCLEMACKPGWGIGIGLFKHAGKDQEFYNSYLPGRKYRFEAWMRQEGIPGGKVVLDDPGIKEAGAPFEVGSEWRRFTHEFTPPAWLTDPRISQTRLQFEGGGRLWVDTPIVSDATDGNGDGKPDVAPNGFKPAWEAELKGFFKTRGGQRGVLRFWGAQSNGPGGTTLEDYLKPAHRCREVGGDASLSLGQFLELCARVNADPWLIVSVSWSEEEWRGLIEYLAGSGETALGRRRIADRGGNTQAWTEAFGRVFLECDNETWNGSFHWNFQGREGVRGDAATAYGAFAELMFQSAKGHPAWAAAKLDEKVCFIVNGWNGQQEEDGYGAMAAKAAPSAAYADVAPYLGGWEQRSFLGGTEFSDAGVSQWLLYMPWRHQGQVDAHTATARALRERGEANYELAVYEGGPGYDLPSPSNPAGVVPESYGKSLGAAITTLDCYLYESLRGYGPQAFFGFRPGTRWSSHVQVLTDAGEKIFPQTVFYALGMRNAFASGPMVAVKAASAPVRDIEALSAKYPAMSGVPLVGCYAFRDGGTWTVFLLSRRMDKRGPDGAEMDAAVTPVVLRLPFQAAGSVRVHRLLGDPRESNVPGLPNQAKNGFKVESIEAPPGAVKNGVFELGAKAGGVTAGGVTGLPPGGIYAVVIEAK